jgi:hypothetical protein
MKRAIIRLIENLPVIGALYLEMERRLFFRYVKRLRAAAGAKLGTETQHTVERGVFTGMKLHPESAFGVDQFTMLSGLYELELYNLIASAAKKDYDAFVDVGCANGFYAVGFARISQRSQVIAYDIDELSRRTTALNAELNGVAHRIAIKKSATPDGLNSLIERYSKVFLLADIEGGEVGLIDPSKCPALYKCDLLVEVHGRTDETAEILRTRFSETHSFRLVSRGSRNPFELELPCHFEDEAWVLVSEGRTTARNNWVLLSRRN